MSLVVEQLSKFYQDQKALDGVSFHAVPGQVLGFLGPNGAGKSTTMKIAAGYLIPDEGDVLVNGVSVLTHPKEVSKVIGYLPEHNPLYLDMYVKEFLSFIAGMYGLSGRKAKSRISEVVSACSLEPEQHKKIGALSKGYRQRVGLAKALVHDPQVIILDEPTTGLDPNQLVGIRKLIKNISKEKTLILSTHVMQEVEALCDKVVIIHKGRIVVQDLLRNLKAGGGSMVLHLEIQENLETVWFEKMEGLGQLIRLEGGYCQLEATDANLLRKAIMDMVQSRDLSLISLRQEEKNLETIFHQLTSLRI